jgi:glycosyltransferase involved in cell wall biosynthesis
MRIVHVYKDIFPVLGGMENHIRLLCRELARDADFDVRILVTNTTRLSDVVSLDGVQVTRTGRLATVASTPISPRLPMELRRLRPDIVHLHFPYPLGEVAALVATPSVPTVITYQSDVVKQRAILRLYAPLLRTVLKRATRILVTSDAYLQSSPWLQPVRDRCLIVPLGIDLGPFLNLQRKGDGRSILFVGRFRYYKGLQFLVEAMPHIPGATLTLVGSGPMEGALLNRAIELGVTDRIRFVSGVSDADLPGYYERADVFVLPASERSEAFGLVLVEACAAALPCISTELGTGTSYVNRDGVTGMVVEPRNPMALAEACNSLLANPDVRRVLGAQARARAQSLFDIRRVAAQVGAIYRDIAKDSARNGHEPPSLT